MRFLSVVKTSEQFFAPPPALMEAMGHLAMEAMQKGVITDTAGLRPTAQATRLRITNGQLTVTDGPFTETKEVIAGYAILNVASHAEALEWSQRFMEVHRQHWPEWEGESELRQLSEGHRPEDCGH